MKKHGFAIAAALPLLLAFAQSASAGDTLNNYFNNNDGQNYTKPAGTVGVPEPASLALLGAGLGALGLRGLRRRKDKK